MRKLKTPDVFACCRALKKIGIKDEIQKIAKEADKAKDIWTKGFDLIWNIFDVATEKKSEKFIYEFLSGPFEMSPKEIEGMELKVLFSNLKQLYEENDLADFFETVGDLTK